MNCLYLGNAVHWCAFKATPAAKNVQVYKQKVKHLLYEHQNSITAFKSNAELGLKLQEDEMQSKSGDLSRDKHSLKLEMKEQVQ